MIACEAMRRHSSVSKCQCKRRGDHTGEIRHRDEATGVPTQRFGQTSKHEPNRLLLAHVICARMPLALDVGKHSSSSAMAACVTDKLGK
jgi:hypothetical protein